MKKWIRLCIFTVFLIGVHLIVHMLRTVIVIQFGIAAFETLHTFVTICTLLPLCLFGFALWQIIKQKQLASSSEDAESLVVPPESEQGNDAILQECKDAYQKKWRGCLVGFENLLSQFDDFNAYQESVLSMLQQTDTLNEKPAELMQKLEDNMYLNAKVLCNYMSVLQARDAVTLQEKLSLCIEKNACLLDKAKDFVLAITDYVGRDLTEGKEQKAIDRIHSYMYVVLDAIKQPEIHLS